MEDKDVIEVTMVDYQASGFGKVTVTKKVTFANGGDFVDLIAQDDTFYVNLFTDAAGNILDLDVFEYEVTGEGTVALSKDNLAGNINLVNKIPEDTDGKLRVQKTDGNGVGLAGASFRLTDEDGSVIDEWTSEASAHELELEPGTYTLTEVQAPTGYTGAGSVTIKVDDDYNFSVSGEIDYSYKGGLLKIVNKATTSTPSSGTPVSGGSTPASYSSALSGKVAVKTGDNTPIGAYAAVLVIAALAIAGGIFYKKKRKNDK